jgi:hypothetical protein
MNLTRREFSSVLTAAAVAGFPLGKEASAQEAQRLYDVPKTGNVHLRMRTRIWILNVRRCSMARWVALRIWRRW